jgi:hypothetical protein
VSAAEGDRMPPHSNTSCYVCGETSIPAVLRRFKPVSFSLCDGCHKIAKRRFNPRRGQKKDRIVQVATKAEWVEALRAACDEKGNCFRSGISGVRLAPTEPSSPLYPTLDHSDPGTGTGGWLVVAAAWRTRYFRITLFLAKTPGGQFVFLLPGFDEAGRCRGADRHSID